MLHILIPRRLRIFGFRRVSTPVLAIVLVLVIILLVITLSPTHVDDTSDAGHEPQADRLSAHDWPLNDGNQVARPELNQLIPVYKDQILGNFEPRLTASAESGSARPGDEGHKYLLDGEGIDWNEVNAKKNEYGMNLVASDHIPMDRTVPDLRHEECKYWHYPTQLPTASVVIVFHNEGFTTLMRTVHSVLLRSPKKFLREVLLVDDYSDKETLKGQLDDYIMENFGEFDHNWSPDKHNDLKGETLKDRTGKVRLIRNKERSGLIRSRARGADEALGEVIVFLDAHCEVNTNWLVPLLAPIALDSHTMTVPIIDGIDSNNFEYRPVYSRNDQHFRGIWEWGMTCAPLTGLPPVLKLKVHWYPRQECSTKRSN